MYLVLIPQVSIAQEQEYIKVAAVTVNKITLLPPTSQYGFILMV